MTSVGIAESEFINLNGPRRAQKSLRGFQMGHRALVAYERPDGLYNLHHSHWGGRNLRLAEGITEETPFGGAEGDSVIKSIYTHYQSASGSEPLGQTDESEFGTDVNPEPREVAVSYDEIISKHLDYQTYEALYVVTLSFDITAYRTFWLGFSTEAVSITRSPTVGHGILLTVRWRGGNPVDDGYLRGWFDGAKRIVANFIDRGEFTESQATTYLIDSFLSKFQYKEVVEVARRDK
jgi:hypothetical protein